MEKKRLLIFIALIVLIVTVGVYFNKSGRTEDANLTEEISQEVEKVSPGLMNDSAGDINVDDMDTENTKNSTVETKKIDVSINEDEQINGIESSDIKNKGTEKETEIQDLNQETQKTKEYVEKNISEETEKITGNTEYVDPYSNEEMIKFMRSDDQNDVVMDVTFMNPYIKEELQQGNFVFNVFMNTHSYEINEIDLGKKLDISTDNSAVDSRQIKWVPDGIAEGHHVSGKIIIPKNIGGQEWLNQQTQYIEISMKDVAGAKEWVYRWTREEVDFDNI